MAESDTVAWNALVQYMDDDYAQWRAHKLGLAKDKGEQAKGVSQKAHRETGAAKQTKKPRKFEKVYDVPPFSLVKVNLTSSIVERFYMTNV